MPDSIAGMVGREMDCEELLECFYGLKDLDRQCFRVLAESDDSLTVDDVADRAGCERSTAYRSIQRLLETDLARREKINYDRGGYYHVYSPPDPDAVADEIQRLLNAWYAQVGQLIQTFRVEYGDSDGGGDATDPVPGGRRQ
jgi:predicted transcriptional regulator